MPEMIEYSAVTAVHTIWLAARSEGIGVGWVSILEPAAVAAILDVPSDWKFIAYLCLGFPQAEDDLPDLARNGLGAAAALGVWCFGARRAHRSIGAGNLCRKRAAAVLELRALLRVGTSRGGALERAASGAAGGWRRR